MKVFLRFKPNISALRQSLSHIPGLGFLSSPSEADWRLHSLGFPWKKFGICCQTSLARAGLTQSGWKMGTKIKKIGNYISNAGSSQHKWNKDGQDLKVFQQHEKNLFKVGEAGWESHSQCPCNYCHVHRRERPQQGKPSLSNLWELRMFPNTTLKSRTVGRYEKKNRIRCEKCCCRGDTLIQRTGNCCGRGLAGAGGNIGKDLKDEDLNLAVDGVERWRFKLESEMMGKAHARKYLMWTIIKVQAWINDWLRVNVSIFRGMSNSSEDVWKMGEKRGLKGYSAYPNIA